MRSRLRRAARDCVGVAAEGLLFAGLGFEAALVFAGRFLAQADDAADVERDVHGGNDHEGEKGDDGNVHNGVGAPSVMSAPLLLQKRGEGETGRGGRASQRDAGSGARAEVVATEFEVEAATREAEFACGARDVAVMFAESFGDHAALKFGGRVGERQALRDGV